MAGPFEVQVHGTKELIAKLDGLQRFRTSPKLRALFDDAGQAYVLLAQRDVPKQSRLLKAAIHHKVEAFGTELAAVRVGVGGNASRYGYYVEVGTKPSVRFARQRRFMHWFQSGSKTLQMPYGLKNTPAGARSIFARRVNHPGTKPQPFFYKHFPTISARFVQALGRILQEEMQAGAGPR